MPAPSHAIAARIDRGVCEQNFANGIDEFEAQYKLTLNALTFLTTIANAGLTPGEPELDAYAWP